MNTFTSLLIVAGSTTAIYAFLIVGVRLFGRRQIGQLTVLDMVVILILGSAVETAMIHADTSLRAGLVSAATLLSINGALTWSFAHSKRLRHLVGGGPMLLVHDGEPVEEHLRRAGMTNEDLLEALRGRGYASPDGIRFAVLETDGSVSVVPSTRASPPASPQKPEGPAAPSASQPAEAAKPAEPPEPAAEPPEPAQG